MHVWLPPTSKIQEGTAVAKRSAHSVQKTLKFMPHHLVSTALWIERIRSKLFQKKISKRYLCLLIALSSGFFYLSWCSFWFGGLLLVAIVPMLAIMKLVTIASKKNFCVGSIFLTLFLWNTLTIWWIYKAAFLGFLFTAFYNALVLTFPWFFYYYMRKWGGLYMGYLGLVSSWLTLEYAHLGWECWELSFPWLNLGNGLAALPQWVQWYAYTGILGGSLWILIVNILIYHFLFEKSSRCLFHVVCLGILLPISISLVAYYSYKEKGPNVEAVVVQPNFDNYTEKDVTASSFIPSQLQIDRLLNLSKQQLTPTTSLLVWPESAIDSWLEETRILHYIVMQPIFHLLETYPVHLITGVSSHRFYGPTKATKTAQIRKSGYTDYFNSVFYLKNKEKIDIYHKQKRVPGGEYIPYFDLLPDTIHTWLKAKLSEIGNIDPCLGQGNGAKVFEIDDQIKVAPIICYELLYGAYAGSSVQKGANLFAVVTNDGWWGNTAVYHQFFEYSRLLAIAHRRSVIRSGNTGVSGFISQSGRVIGATKQLEVAAMRGVVCANNKMTFYSLYGDYIGEIAAWICLILFWMVFLIRCYRKNRARKSKAKSKIYMA